MTAPVTTYDQQFFADMRAGSARSAHTVVPMLRDLIDFSSVVDVGCGTGAWLAAFATSGINDYRGLDGAWAEKAGLEIPRDRFIAADLASPPSLGRVFDLAISLEVAEHLPPSAADRFVTTLAELAPVVIFSAAIPGQGGTSHVNEQWPDYWSERFAARGYACFDVLRLPLWNNPNVQWWYAQNMLVFVDRTRLADYPRLTARAARSAGDAPPLRLVHPGCLAAAAARPLDLGRIVRAAPGAAKRAILERLGRR